VKRIELKVSPQNAGIRLDQFIFDQFQLREDLKHFSKARIKQLLTQGAVYLNRKRVHIASKNLFAHALVEVMLSNSHAHSTVNLIGRDIDFMMSDQYIAYEDDSIIVVNKPEGVPTQPTIDQSRKSLYIELKKYLQQRDGPEAYLGLHHRLDRDTSGLVLFTKQKSVNAAIGNSFKEHTISKTYQALVLDLKPIPDAWSVKNYLKRSPLKKLIMESTLSGGDFAHTEFKKIATEKLLGHSVVRVEAKLLTGRTHQIRVHCSEYGIPIVGDPLYSKMTQKDSEIFKRLYLHAWKLEFKHPVTGQVLSVLAPLPF
jgi:RluA family pseudouridine synthase